ncbi:MAG: tRNA (N6-isopentenyl adenosine(37)-C2)-methylthiotransferase MiaB [Fimbriimonadaceae bacterium]
MTSALFRPEELADVSCPKRERGTYFVQTWGCQMNEEDSEQLALHLQTIGFRRTSSMLEAHVILLNTCSVRRKPEDKAFSMLGELAILKKRRPEIIVGVCGCMAQLRADEIRQRAPFVDFVLGTGDISKVGGLVEEAAQSRRFAKRVELPSRKGAVVTDVPLRKVDRSAKLKAFVPIQYGCDKFCTFCIVPTTRGRERSRATHEIIQEVTQLVDRGTREVTLLGQTVNSYGKNLLEGRVPFSQLLKELAEIDGLKRIRFMSPYPRDFKQDLIATMRDCPKVPEHVHLPLQSGDNDVLAAMHRVYTRESFLEIVRELRAAMPGVGLTTDIIAGFPGETEEQFENTLSLLEEVRFDGAYSFIYSPRPGTPAGEMEQVPIHVRKSRVDRLIARQNEITIENNARCLGRTFEVLVEGPSPKNPSTLQGYSREWRMMHFEGSPELAGELVNVEATEAHRWGLMGRLV